MRYMFEFNNNIIKHKDFKLIFKDTNVCLYGVHINNIHKYKYKLTDAYGMIKQINNLLYLNYYVNYYIKCKNYFIRIIREDKIKELLNE